MGSDRRDDGALSRRAVITGTGSLTATALAGCLGNVGDGGSPTEESVLGEGSSDSVGTTAGAQTLRTHPAAAGIDSQPRLGPDPFEAEAVIVAFEDPSCPTCRRFEREVVPQIESDLVEPGQAAFAFRGYPVIYPWGEPATQALESTFARDADAHWALASHYFDEQPSFDTGNVLERTETFLAENTDLDAGAVVEDAEAKAHDAAVQADLDAGRAAGAGLTTPTLFMFKDGEYRTKTAGSVSFSVIENALGQ